MANDRLSPAIRDYLRKLGSKGGKARSAALDEAQKSKAASKAVRARWKGTTKEERSEAARKAARARWGRKP